MELGLCGTMGVYPYNEVVNENGKYVEDCRFTLSEDTKVDGCYTHSDYASGELCAERNFATIIQDNGYREESMKLNVESSDQRFVDNRGSNPAIVEDYARNDVDFEDDDLEYQNAENEYPYDSNSKISSRFKVSDNKVLKELKLISSQISVPEIVELFKEKIDQSSVILNFQDPNADIDSKKIKQDDLVDLYLYIKHKDCCIPTELYGPLFSMVSKNLVSVPLPNNNQYDHHECIDFTPPPSVEPAWVHLRLVYAIVTDLISSQHLDLEEASKYLGEEFVGKLFELFSSGDPREKDSLKALVHCIYGRFEDLRPSMRKMMNNILLQTIYGYRDTNGVCEVLEIIDSIVTGLSLPLKDEYITLFEKIIIPLHKSPDLLRFHAQICVCVARFIKKCPGLSTRALSGLLKYWPKTNSIKEILFLTELEEILGLTALEHFQPVKIPLFKQLSSCIMSMNYHVSERALIFWDNEKAVELISSDPETLLSIVFKSIYTVSRSPANKSTYKLVHNALSSLMKSPYMDLYEYEGEQKKAKQAAEDLLSRREKMWERVEYLAECNRNGQSHIQGEGLTPN